jgi:hypothetical protein
MYIFTAISNICERLFSNNARIIMNHLRRSMDPSTCELLLFLKFNKEIWSDPKIIDEVLTAASDDEDSSDDDN